MISAALITDDIVCYGDNHNVLYSKQFYESIFGNLDEVAGSDKDPKYLIDNCDNVPEIYMACGLDDFLFEKNADFYRFLKSKDIDAIFVGADGEHTWEFCDEFIKEFIKRL